MRKPKGNRLQLRVLAATVAYASAIVIGQCVVIRVKQPAVWASQRITPQRLANAGVLHQRLEAGVLATSPPLLTEGPNRQGNGIEMFGKAKSSGRKS